jgi:hypothetical protein
MIRWFATLLDPMLMNKVWEVMIKQKKRKKVVKWSRTPLWFRPICFLVRGPSEFLRPFPASSLFRPFNLWRWLDSEEEGRLLLPPPQHGSSHGVHHQGPAYHDPAHRKLPLRRLPLRACLLSWFSCRRTVPYRLALSSMWWTGGWLANP